MATNFNGSHEIGPENIQTLYLMNPDFTSYSDATPPPTNMILLNPSTTSPNSISLAEPQYLVGIPVHSIDSAASASIHYNLLSPMIAYHSSTQQLLSLSLPMTQTADEVKTSGSQSFLIDSRYLKLAQQLLDEVVSVRKGNEDGPKSWAMLNGDGDHNKSGEQIAKCSVEMTSSDMQELQMKKAKLLNMLDEVGQRYKNYHYQLQLLVSSFEAAAGIESAKAYTSLAFETISKRFRCLRDAIAGQIRAAVVCLGEGDITEGRGKPRVSRFQFDDRQLRQQRALQQLGMIQQNAWRPQRGLPERSVSVLRAWLFEHFLHPYPKDSDKLLLAKQTGLSKSQVSNWFINARVRLWKPMVEEMYIDEVKEHEQSNADEGTGKANFTEDSQHESSPTRTEQSYPQDPSITIHSSSSNFHNRASYGEENDLFIHATMKKARSEESMNGQNENHAYPLITGSMIQGDGFEGYSVGEIERFNFKPFAPSLSSNGVSLTLGLTHYESLPLLATQPPYLSSESIPFESNGFSSIKTPSVAHASNKYESLSTESRKRFDAHLFPDFMA